MAETESLSPLFLRDLLRSFVHAKEASAFTSAVVTQLVRRNMIYENDQPPQEEIANGIHNEVGRHTFANASGHRIINVQNKHHSDIRFGEEKVVDINTSWIS